MLRAIARALATLADRWTRFIGVEPEPRPGVYLTPAAQAIVNERLAWIRHNHDYEDGIVSAVRRWSQVDA